MQIIIFQLKLFSEIKVAMTVVYAIFIKLYIKTLILKIYFIIRFV